MAPLNDPGDARIIDIRRQEIRFSVLDDMRRKLRPRNGKEKKMPTLLLYDEKGLKLFEEITYLEEYYLTKAEIEVLEKYADHIVERIQSGSQVIELGSGNLRKVNILLQALERAHKDVDYFALDLSLPELERTLQEVPKGIYEHVRCYGLHGTYDDGLEWLKQPEHNNRPKCILFLGSSIGNFTPQEAAEFLKSFTPVMGEWDSMLIGVDACQDKEKVFHAYNDREGTTHEFVRNGLAHANVILGKEAFKQQDWEIIGEYDEVAARHQAFYSAVRDTDIEGVRIRAGERVRVEESYKYSLCQSSQLWEDAGLAPRAVFGNSAGDYHLHMLSTSKFMFPLKAEQYAAQPVPSLAEFEQLWASWDLVTRYMIPEDDLLSKPIKLRNCCLFYLGHIPTFLDVHLARATDGAPTEPCSYRNIFERGIDPDVDNPENCHAHSEIPDTWPSVEEILDFQNRVRSRVRSLYKNNKAETYRKLGRALWLGFEHEVMHLETLLYMLLQSDRTRPPPGVTPDFESLARQAATQSVPNQWFRIPAQQITLGLDDSEHDFGPVRYYGWDNEKPRRQVDIPAFDAKARPVTNEDYARYLEQTQKDSVPASWTTISTRSEKSVSNGTGPKRGIGGNVYINGHSEHLTDVYLRGKAVKTVYGLVPLEHALDWPVMASYDELAGCAKWMDGRIPTVEEARSIYTFVDRLKRDESGNVDGRTISAVNGHLVNDGVEESPPSHPSHQSISNTEQSLNPHQLFADLENCNVGFKHFHPIPVTQQGGKLSGQGELGGVWEWTSSVLEKHQGFKAMELYPGYTEDFFDGKHNIILGGSWATHPRIAGRKTFVNWYQRNYPYVWAGARLVRDF